MYDQEMDSLSNKFLLLRFTGSCATFQIYTLHLKLINWICIDVTGAAYSAKNSRSSSVWLSRPLSCLLLWSGSSHKDRYQTLCSRSKLAQAGETLYAQFKMAKGQTHWTSTEDQKSRQPKTKPNVFPGQRAWKGSGSGVFASSESAACVGTC